MELTRAVQGDQGDRGASVSKSVIVLEFNELTPSLMDRFIAEGRLPNFERLRSQSIVATTDASDEADVVLNPWIQWVTVHTGHPYSRHKVFHLSDGPKYRAPRVWDMVDEAGGKFWLCGSMNTARQPATVHGLALPDPWATDIEPYPNTLFKDYYKLVSTYVQEYTSDSPSLAKSDYVKFARFMATNGLSAKTVAAAARQIASEGAAFKWRRATILDRLQWDVFKHHYRREKPTFSTFFLNSTAHFQHFYWRNMDHTPFSVKPTEEQQVRFADAIRYGYEQMDKIVGECLALAGPDTTVVLCTALSQQPLVKYDVDGGRQLFKPTDPGLIVQLAGLDLPFQYDQVMSDKFYLTFADEPAADLAAERLGALRLDSGEPFLRFIQEGARLVIVCAVNQIRSPETLVVSPHTQQSAAFCDLVYPIEGIKSGMHHPDGMLWIRTPARRSMEVERKVSLCEIAPTLLALCGIDAAGRFDYPALSEVLEPPAVPRQAAA